jgi:translation initiation factor RLI1
MASLHALVDTHQQPVFIQVAVSQQERLHKLIPRGIQNKWIYLLANNVKFQHKQQYTISMPKPINETLYNWLESLIQAGKSSVIYVEQLDLDEISIKRLKQLCSLHGVTLVNLLLSAPQSDNLLKGPWLN